MRCRINPIPTPVAPVTPQIVHPSDLDNEGILGNFDLQQFLEANQNDEFNFSPEFRNGNETAESHNVPQAVQDQPSSP